MKDFSKFFKDKFINLSVLNLSCKVFSILPSLDNAIGDSGLEYLYEAVKERIKDKSYSIPDLNVECI